MTKSDGEMERMVEEWLEAEARPMPQHVLESSLEAVARTRQTGFRSPADGPRRTMRFALVAATAAFAVVVILGAPTILRTLDGLLPAQPGSSPDTSAAQVRVWDAAADFIGSPDQQNPSPDRYGNPAVWSYLRSRTNMHNPGVYLPLPNFQVAESDVDLWYERDLTNLFVGHLGRSTSLSVHPWSDGDPANDHNAVVGWTSPTDGWFVVMATARVVARECPGPADGITFTIDQNAAVLRATSVPMGEARTLEVATLLEAGDGLYFVVAPGANAQCDATDLTITITRRGDAG
jgi:hypothetical protein